MIDFPRLSTFATLCALAVSAAASAQMNFEDEGFTTEASLSGSGKTGNTESTDLGLSFKLRYESQLWRHSFATTFDWGRADGEPTKNRLTTTYEAGRLINDRLYGFGRGAYEVDAFSGYDSRAVIGGGLGLDVLRGETRSWSLQGGPAYRIDEVQPSYDDMDVLIAPGGTQSAVALSLGSRFEAQLNDVVTVANDTDFTSSSDTSSMLNTASLTAELMRSLSARFSFEVAHDTSPPPGVKDTDTTTRAALVFTLGGD